MNKSSNLLIATALILVIGAYSFRFLGAWMYANINHADRQPIALVVVGMVLLLQLVAIGLLLYAKSKRGVR
jgi:hypothetical protein